MNIIDRELSFSAGGSSSEFLGVGHQVRDLDIENISPDLLQDQESKVESVDFQEILEKKVSSISDFENSVAPSDDEEFLKSGDGINKGNHLTFLDFNEIENQNFILETKEVSLIAHHSDTENLKLNINNHHNVKMELLGLDLNEKDVNDNFSMIDEDVNNDEVSVGTDGIESYLSFVLDIPNDSKIVEQFSLYSGDIAEENTKEIPLRMVSELHDVLTEVKIDTKVEVEISGSCTEDSTVINQEFTKNFIDYVDSTSNVEVGSLKVDGQIQTEEPLIIVSDHRPFLEFLDGKKIISDPIGSIKNALSTTGNTEIVHRVQFMLKNEGEGEIRLFLSPESLGVVHMKLNLGNGIVSGRIFVGNSYVQAAFEENMSNLRDAMERTGIILGDVEVSVDQGYSKHGSKENRENAWDFDRASISQGYENTGLNLSYVQGSIDRLNSINNVMIDLRA